MFCFYFPLISRMSADQIYICEDQRNLREQMYPNLIHHFSVKKITYTYK